MCTAANVAEDYPLYYGGENENCFRRFGIRKNPSAFQLFADSGRTD